MQRVLIATDGSNGASQALEQGFELAAEVGATALVVYVRQPPASFLGAPYYQDAITEEAGHARGVIADAKLHAMRYDLEIDYEVVEGDPVDAILSLASSRDADLIVIGSRGLGTVRTLVLGSVSNAVLHRADRPVLLAKAPVHAAAAA